MSQLNAQICEIDIGVFTVLFLLFHNRIVETTMVCSHSRGLLIWVPIDVGVFTILFL